MRPAASRARPLPRFRPPYPNVGAKNFKFCGSRSRPVNCCARSLLFVPGSCLPASFHIDRRAQPAGCTLPLSLFPVDVCIAREDRPLARKKVDPCSLRLPEVRDGPIPSKSSFLGFPCLREVLPGLRQVSVQVTERAPAADSLRKHHSLSA